MRIQGSERRYAETKISTTRGAEGEGEPGVMRAADFGELVLLGDETAIRLAGQVRGRGVRFSVLGPYLSIGLCTERLFLC